MRRGPRSPIKIGFPIPLSGPTAVYGVPILKGAQMAVAEINAKGGVLGRKLEILPRDSKANADEAVRLARELIIKDNVDFLVGTLTSAEAPAVSTVAKENKIVFHGADGEEHDPDRRRRTSTPTSSASPRTPMSRGWPGRPSWPNAGRQDSRDDRARLRLWPRRHRRLYRQALKKLRPDIQIVDQQWPKLGEPDFTAFITAQMGKKPDAVYCSLFAGDFVTFAKQATPLGYFKAINNRLVDGGEVGTPDEAQALGADYPYGIIGRRLRPGDLERQRAAGAQEVHRRSEELHQVRNTLRAGRSWATHRSRRWPRGIKKAGSTNRAKVAKAMLGLTFDTPVGKRTFSVKSHETFAPNIGG